MKISIGIPIFGVEKYIERCARSLFEQTYANIEYVFVNDCTKDRSMDILFKVIEDYPNRKQSVKVINHDKNSGSSASRNSALDAFTGDFVMWVDSDDWLERNAVSMLVEMQVETQCDIITFDSTWHYPQKTAVFHNEKIKFPHELLLGIFKRTNLNAIWGRFIRRELYEIHHIRCYEGINIGEDFQQITQLLYYADSVCVLNEPLYHYECSNMGSYMSSFSENKTLQAIQSLLIVKDFLIDKEENLLEEFYVYMAYSLSTFMAGAVNNNNKRCYDRIFELLRQMPDSTIHSIPLSYRMLYLVNNYRMAKYYAHIGKVLRRCNFIKK